MGFLITMTDWPIRGFSPDGNSEVMRTRMEARTEGVDVGVMGAALGEEV